MRSEVLSVIFYLINCQFSITFIDNHSIALPNIIFFWLDEAIFPSVPHTFMFLCPAAGEEALAIFVDKRRLSRTADLTDSNGTAVTLEALHQLAASYFIDRESTLRKLHHLQIASTAIKVTLWPRWAQTWGPDPQFECLFLEKNLTWAWLFLLFCSCIIRRSKEVG